MSVATASRRVVPTARRIDQRLRYGDVTSMRQAAQRELAAGNPDNAFACLQGALAHVLRLKWLAMPGHENSSITNAEALVLKLRCATKIDAWTHDVLMRTFRGGSRSLNPQSVHVLDFLIEALALDLRLPSSVAPKRAKGGAAC
jgi:hypothetical protein